MSIQFIIYNLLDNMFEGAQSLGIFGMVGLIGTCVITGFIVGFILRHLIEPTTASISTNQKESLINGYKAHLHYLSK